MELTEDYYTQAELARRWKVSKSTIKNYEDAGILEAFRPTKGVVRYTRGSIELYEQENTGKQRQIIVRYPSHYMTKGKRVDK
jgi:DNA-binding transcriptional MerR regulator